MNITRHGITGLLLLALWTVPAAAQEQTVQTGPPAAPLDADKLPISLARIRAKLAQIPPSEREGALRLQYYVEVYGKRNVPLDMLGDFNLAVGPVPYGAPSHRELISFITPQEFRAPVADLLTPTRAILDWLARKAGGSRSGAR